MVEKECLCITEDETRPIEVLVTITRLGEIVNGVGVIVIGTGISRGIVTKVEGPMERLLPY